MMILMRFFYDYECPYCQRGYGYLREFIGDHPEIDLEWRPIEAHPRPENHPPHTDLCVQSYYIARELGADMEAFHRKMFQAAALERRNVEKVEVLAEILGDIVDPGKFRSILESNKYALQVTENNDLAYEQSGVWAVPAFRILRKGAPEKRLDSPEGMGLNRDQIREFLEHAGT
ncbi:DsbA family protein [Treponema sp. TIM-1]|uniref:DsbA family oxidoreductase n=1 Tax=Treponema sp. TIM-1 TaxID=2898417 RepID=UPI003980D08F